MHRTISAIRAKTRETINRGLLVSARQEKIEAGRVVRFDSTVTAALMHEPSDSSFLWDAVRVTACLLETSDTLVSGLEWRNHRRTAKKRARFIEYARDRRKQVQHYRELIKLTQARRSQPTKKPSACSSRMPTSSSEAAATFRFTSSTLHRPNWLDPDLVIEAGNPADGERSFPCSDVISPPTARRPD